MMMKGLRVVLDVSLSILVVWFRSLEWYVRDVQVLPQY